MSSNYFKPLDQLSLQELLDMVSTFKVITPDLMVYLTHRFNQDIQERGNKLDKGRRNK